MAPSSLIAKLGAAMANAWLNFLSPARGHTLVQPVVSSATVKPAAKTSCSKNEPLLQAQLSVCCLEKAEEMGLIECNDLVREAFLSRPGKNVPAVPEESGSRGTEGRKEVIYNSCHAATLPIRRSSKVVAKGLISTRNVYFREVASPCSLWISKTCLGDI